MCSISGTHFILWKVGISCIWHEHLCVVIWEKRESTVMFIFIWGLLFMIRTLFEWIWNFMDGYDEYFVLMHLRAHFNSLEYIYLWKALVSEWCKVSMSLKLLACRTFLFAHPSLWEIWIKKVKYAVITHDLTFFLYF